MKHLKKQDIQLLLFIILFYGILQLLGITCPIKFLTGVSCPGCGMTRAWISFVFFHSFSKAMAFHPLFLLVPPAALIYIFQNKLPKWIYYILVVSIVILFLGVYIARQFNPDDVIVVFAPEHGLIYKCLSYLYKTIMGVL